MPVSLLCKCTAASLAPLHFAVLPLCSGNISCLLRLKLHFCRRNTCSRARRHSFDGRRVEHRQNCSRTWVPSKILAAGILRCHFVHACVDPDRLRPGDEAVRIHRQNDSVVGLAPRDSMASTCVKQAALSSSVAAACLPPHLRPSFCLTC